MAAIISAIKVGWADGNEFTKDLLISLIMYIGAVLQNTSIAIEDVCSTYATHFVKNSVSYWQLIGFMCHVALPLVLYVLLLNGLLFSIFSRMKKRLSWHYYTALYQRTGDKRFKTVADKQAGAVAGVYFLDTPIFYYVDYMLWAMDKMGVLCSIVTPAALAAGVEKND